MRRGQECGACGGLGHVFLPSESQLSRLYRQYLSLMRMKRENDRGTEPAQPEVRPILAVSHEPCFLLSSKGDTLGNPHLNGARSYWL